MNIEWVDDSVVDSIHRGSKQATISPVMRSMISALESNPGVWAKFPLPVPANSSIARWKTIWPNLEYRITGGNNLPLKDPKHKDWTVYVRYVPKQGK